MGNGIVALQLDRMTSDEVKEYLRSGPGIAILPVGPTEQHGVHGSLGTDTFAATCIALKVAERVNGVVLPALAYGNSTGHQHWPGTVGLPPSLLASLARTARSQAERQKAYFEIQRLIHADAPMILLFYPREIATANAKLKGIVPSPFRIYHNIEEW